jgi:hypothetical protein
VRVADPGGEHRHEAPDVIHRRAQTGRHLPGVSRNERWPRRFGDMLLASWCSPTIPSSSGPAAAPGRTEARCASPTSQPHRSPPPTCRGSCPARRRCRPEPRRAQPFAMIRLMPNGTLPPAGTAALGRRCTQGRCGAGRARCRPATRLRPPRAGPPPRRRTPHRPRAPRS